MNKYKVVYANSLDELQLKSLGCHHDHAYPVYFGKTVNLPEKHKDKANDNSYIFIYYEDIPIIKCVICGKTITAYEVCEECSKTNDPFRHDSDKHEYLPGTKSN